jgi:hypothetical protein
MKNVIIILLLISVGANRITSQQVDCISFIEGNPQQIAIPSGGIELIEITNPIRLAIHIGKYSDGSGGVDESKLTNEINTLNNIFAQTGLSFEIYSTDYILNSSLMDCYGINEVIQLRQINQFDGCINIYYVHLVKIEDCNNSLTLVNGLSNFPWDNYKGIIMSNFCIANTAKTLSHEVGHYLGLYHTHESFCETLIENIERNPTNPCYNADDA